MRGGMTCSAAYELDPSGHQLVYKSTLFRFLDGEVMPETSDLVTNDAQPVNQMVLAFSNPKDPVMQIFHQGYVQGHMDQS